MIALNNGNVTAPAAANSSAGKVRQRFCTTGTPATTWDSCRSAIRTPLKTMPFFIPLTACAFIVARVGAIPRMPSMIIPVAIKTSAHNAPCESTVVRTATTGFNAPGNPAAKFPEPKSATPGATMDATAASSRQRCAFTLVSGRRDAVRASVWVRSTLNKNSNSTRPMPMHQAGEPDSKPAVTVLPSEPVS